jgi:hypothetical protein
VAAAGGIGDAEVEQHVADESGPKKRHAQGTEARRH